MAGVLGPPPIDRVLAKIVVHPLGCWEFQGALRAGYGLVGSGGQGGTTLSVHRVVYEDLVGPIPEGLTLDHLCRNPRCVNPAHLQAVTQAENNRRRDEHHRRVGTPHYNQLKTHCKQGHEFTPDSTQIPSGERRRVCRICAVARSRAHHLKRKAEATT